MGKTNFEILASTLFLVSKLSIVTGKVAEDEAVPKAVVKALPMFRMNRNGSVRVTNPEMGIKWILIQIIVKFINFLTVYKR